MFLLLTLGVALAALVFALRTLMSGMKSGDGAPDMLEVSAGAEAALYGAFRAQAGLFAPVALGAAALVFSSLVLFSSQSQGWAVQAAFSFIIGAGSQAAAAFVYSRILSGGVMRTAGALRRSGSEAFTQALRTAGASSILTLALSLAGVAGMFLLTGGWHDARGAALKIAGFCLGSVFTALFFRLSGGGGRGAPAGPGSFRDRAQGAALLGADALDSAAAENISAMILGAALWPVYGPKAVIFPLFARACGLAACAAGVMGARPAAGGDHVELLDRGLTVAGGTALAGLFLGCALGLDNNMWLFTAAVIGLVSANLFIFSARYYGEYKPRLARLAAGASPAGSVAGSLSAGFESAVSPAVLTAAALLGSYYCGVRGLENYSVPGAFGERACGLYGIALFVVGALSVSGYALALGVFGAITGGARELCELTRQEPALRQESGVLAAAGRTGTASAMGYGGTAAVLAAVLLFSAYMSETARLTGLPFETVNLAGVEGFAGGLLGAAVLAAFCAFCFREGGSRDSGRWTAIKHFLLTVSPALALPAAAMVFRRSGHGPEVIAAVLISVIVCGSLVSAFVVNAAASLENSSLLTKEGVSAMAEPRESAPAVSALLKFLPAMALALAAVFA